MPATQTIDLETELRYFNEHRFELLRDSAGKFALVKGDALIGVFESETTAIRHGYEVLGNVAFLVKQVTEADIPLSFTSFNLGVSCRFSRYRFRICRHQVRFFKSSSDHPAS